MFKIFIFSLILQISLYTILPKEYSFTLCIVFMTIYLFQSFLYLQYINKLIGFLSFDLFFLFGIFIVTFYPLFNLDDLYRSRNFAKINESYINKATLLALIGVTGYMLSGSYVFFRNRYLRQALILKYSKRLMSFCAIAIVVLLIIFIAANGLDYLYAYSLYNGSGETLPRTILDNIKIFLVILAVQTFIKDRSLTIKEIVIRNKILFALSLFIVLLLVLGGTRNLPYQIILMLVGAYNFIVRRIKAKYIVFGLIIGIIANSVIGMARGQMYGQSTILQSSLSNVSFLNSKVLFYELSIACAPLYYFIELVDTNSMAYGMGMLLPALSIFPFMQSFVIDLFDIKRQYLMPSSLIATRGIYESFDSGIGTHMIGDLYYNFGFFGVLLFMSLLGFIVSSFTVKISKNPSAMSLTGYVSLFAISIFYARAEYMYPYRFVILSLMITYIFSLRSRNYRNS